MRPRRRAALEGEGLLLRKRGMRRRRHGGAGGIELGLLLLKGRC